MLKRLTIPPIDMTLPGQWSRRSTSSTSSNIFVECATAYAAMAVCCSLHGRAPWPTHKYGVLRSTLFVHTSAPPKNMWISSKLPECRLMMWWMLHPLSYLRGKSACVESSDFADLELSFPKRCAPLPRSEERRVGKECR